MRKSVKILVLTLILITLGVGLVTVNRDLYQFSYDTLLERTFTPEVDAKQDYLISEQVALKPGEYMLSPELSVTGNGSGIFLLDANEHEIFYVDLRDGMENPSFDFMVEGESRQVRLGIRYDGRASTIRVSRMKITSEHVLYKESLLRHATVSAVLCLLALWLGLRLIAPDFLFRLFPLFRNPQNELALAILLGLTLAACYPLLDGNTYVRGEDMFFHLTRIRGLAESLRAGYFPVRDQLYWLHNYGYGVGFYYPDVFLYFPAVLLLLGFNLLTAYKIFLVVCSFFSILSTWYAAEQISGSRTAAYAAAAFMAFASYRLSNVYYRGAVGETQAAAFYPLIILGLYEIFYGRKDRWPLFALGFLGLFCCHLISLAMAAVVTALFLLTQLRRIFSDREIIRVLLKSVLLVIGIGAFFWMPMLEQSLTNPELKINNVLAGDVKLNRTNYAFPVSNILSRFKTWNFAFQADRIYPGWSLLLVPLLGISVRKKRDRAVHAADFMLVFGILLVWMCTRAFPWKWPIFLPFVIRIQFAYRLLLPATALLSLCGGIYFAALVRDRSPWLWLGLLTLFCFFSTGFPVLQESAVNRSVDKRLFVMQDNRVSGAEYLPLGLDSAFPGQNADTIFISDGNVPLTITTHKRQRLTFSFSYELPEDSGEIQFSVPLIYYTGFQGTLTADDGTEIHPEIGWDARGLVSLSNSGYSKGNVLVYYEKTMMQRCGEAITIMSLLIWLFVCRRNRRMEKNVVQRV